MENTEKRLNSAVKILLENKRYREIFKLVTKPDGTTWVAEDEETNEDESKTKDAACADSPAKVNTSKSSAFPETKTTSTGRPSINQEKLHEILIEISNEIEEKFGVIVYVPRSESGKQNSASRKYWLDYEKYHPFIKQWLEVYSNFPFSKIQK